MKKITVLIFAVIISAGLLYAKSVRKTRRLWNAEVPAAAVDIESDGDFSVNNNLSVDKTVSVTTTTVTGQIKLNNTKPLYFMVAVDTTSVTPSAAGQVILGDDYNLYISSGVGGNWYKVGGK